MALGLDCPGQRGFHYVSDMPLQESGESGRRKYRHEVKHD